MFIDIHVHPAFYEPISKDSAVLELRHNKLGIYQNGIAPIEHIRNQMQCAGLTTLCLLAQDYSSTDGVIVSNEEVALLVKENPDIFIGFASVDPANPDAAEKLEFAFSNLKLSGLKLNPAKGKYFPYDKRLHKIYDLCEKYNKPIMFHSGLCWEPDTLSKYSRPLEFEELALNRPNLRFCLAHMGWPWVKETAMLLLKYPNVYADTGLLFFDSAREFFNEIFVKEVPSTWIDRSLRHQIMFGSNNPRFEQIRMADALNELGFRDSTVELIKYKNALDFLEGK